MKFDKPEQERWSQVDGFIPPHLTEMDEDDRALDRVLRDIPSSSQSPVERPHNARAGVDSPVAPCALRPGGLSGASRTHSPLGGDAA